MFDDVIENLNRERSVTFFSTSEYEYVGMVHVNGGDIKLGISVKDGFPKCFPVIRILDYSGFLPHVSSNGEMCLFNMESVMIREDRPNEIMLDSYDRAIEILNMDPMVRKREIFREFATYWDNKTIKNVSIYSNLIESKLHEYQEYLVIGSNQKWLVVSDSIDESKYILKLSMNCIFDEDKMIQIPCIRIRLRESALPPKMNKPFAWSEIRNFILRNITGSQKRRFKWLLSGRNTTINMFLLLVIPSMFGDQYACLWLHYKNHKNMALKNIPDCKVEAVKIIRMDQTYMLARGGAETNMKENSVLLIGCGSIGGFIAENICQCGINKLDILDKDKLTVDNVHRHVLGFNDAVAGEYKAKLMKSHLEAKYPHVDIDSLDYNDRTAETFLREPSRLKKYDLIISATGNPTVDLAINDKLCEMKEAPSFVVCFNEPYGIGGHAVAILKNGACLRCLYSDPVSGELVPFLGSFVKPNQSFLKSMSGCAGTYVEYSALDSQQTAIMATRLIIDVLNGKVDHTRLNSWIGPTERLEEAGYEASEYYKELVSEGLTTIAKDIPRVERCITCGR